MSKSLFGTVEHEHSSLQDGENPFLTEIWRKICLFWIWLLKWSQLHQLMRFLAQASSYVAHFFLCQCLVLLQLSYTSTVTNREIQLKLGLNSELDPLLMGEKIRFGPKQLASSHSFPAKWTWVSYENFIFSATDDAQVRNDCLNRLLTYIYLLIASF